MSSQKGNVNRSRPQKYKNSHVFKNTKYDTSDRTKTMLSTPQDGLCARCRDTIAWKLKYKKYKPLTQPATCNRCHQKTVKKAYYTVCEPCATDLGVCAKCAVKKQIVTEFGPDEQTQAAEQCQMEQEIKFLSERERRTLYRLKAQGKVISGAKAGGGDNNNEDEDDDDDSDDNDDSNQGFNLATAADPGSQQSAGDGKDSGCDDDGEEKVDAHTLFD